MHSFSNYDTTQQELTVRAQNIIAKGKINLDKKQALKQVLGFIDLTTLSGDDTTQKVTELCAKAESFFDGDKGIPNVAAVCVYPVFANTVHHA